MSAKSNQQDQPGQAQAGKKQKGTLERTAPAFKFSDTKLLALKGEKGVRVVYLDLLIRGLGVRVTVDRRGETNRTFFVYRWEKRGAPKRLTLGRFPDDLDYEKASVDALKINLAIAQGETVVSVAQATRDEITLGDLFEEYFDKQLKKHGKDAEKGRKEWEWYLGEMPDYPVKKGSTKRKKAKGSVNWQHRPLSSITAFDIDDMHTSMGTHTGKGSANHALVLLHAMFNKAIKWGYFKGQNPASGIRKFRSISRDRFLQRDEIPLFLEALAYDPSVDNRHYLLLSIMEGARKSNMLAMRWEDLNLTTAVWRIPGEVTKNGHPLTVPLMPAAVKILEQRAAVRAPNNPWVFPTDQSASGHRENPYKAWGRVKQRCELIRLVDLIAKAEAWSIEEIVGAKSSGMLEQTIAELRARAAAQGLETANLQLKEIVIHDLRRTLGSWMAGTGASTVITAAALGHKSISMAQIYQRAALEPVRAAMDSAATAILVAGGLEMGPATSLETLPAGEKHVEQLHLARNQASDLETQLARSRLAMEGAERELARLKAENAVLRAKGKARASTSKSSTKAAVINGG
jgi:integrase